MAEDGGLSQHLWPSYITLTALLLSLLVLGQILATHYAAFKAAPAEMDIFLDALEFSSRENGSYDCDVDKVQRFEDRVRLNRILRDMRKCTDDLREQVRHLTTGIDSAKLRRIARILWATKRPHLEERVRRLDLLRMRFLVVYMGVVATQTPAVAERSSPMPSPKPIPTPPPLPGNFIPTPPITPKPPPLPKDLSAPTPKTQPLKKSSTAPLTKQEAEEKEKDEHRMGWAGVIAELQKSPLLHKRHASVESAMASKIDQRTAAKSSSP